AALAGAVFAPATEPAPVAEAAQSVLHGLYWLVANLAERSPVLLVVDDLQWADGPSLRFLVYLARRLEGVPVALMLASRSGEPSAQGELLQALRLEADPPVLEPRPLSPRATRDLAAARLGRAVAEDRALACHEATRGNPFLLSELLHELGSAPDDGAPVAVDRMASERVATAILLRVGRAGSRASALVRAASVLGQNGDVATAAALAGIDPVAAAELADALARAQILEPGPSSHPLRFVHPLVRSAVYDDMPRPERARLHARAAQLLADVRGGADAAAAHLLQTDPAGDERVVELLRRAARAALSRGAPESAAELLRRAEREPPPESVRPALLVELGAAAAWAGQADGVELLREGFQSTAEQPARALAGLELAFALGVSRSGSAEAVGVLERCGDGLLDDELRTLVDARLATFAINVPVLRPRFAELLLRARAAVDRPPSDAVRALLAPVAVDLALTGAAAADVARVAERALEGGRLMRRDVETERDFAATAAIVLIHAGELRSARRHIDEGLALARARGSQFALARVCVMRALACLGLGELDAAEADAHTALSVVAAWGIPHAVSTAVIAAVQIQRGDLDAAQAALDAIDSDPALLEVTINQAVREARAALWSARGRPREALRELLACAAWEQQSGVRRGTVAWRTAAALVQLELGDGAAAHELAETAVQDAREYGAAPRLGNALRAQGIVEGAAAGLALLEEAVGVLEGSGARLDHARALVDLGALLRRGANRAAGTDRLREGMELANRCGATALVDSAANELRLAGARPRRIALSGRESLTPSERRVADLAARALSNKEIAQALFVTLRTVEMHLSNAYRKLGIASRRQLAVALGVDASRTV
ncbi:MAG: hypothetical protein QOE31_1479, partial [Solirubrobacteraceae bacterium]|nr:hypothetical protein [Solirubrobacteraceae bacterium]